ncbi:MAG: hypothetical protein SH848_13445 [Saprospiraceae bacterium]|nr:hypothetical protein [Saprospiraceae bacterium]MDZ4704933.1 hypothetical protein [Saprospiraceae bacterium]
MMPFSPEDLSNAAAERLRSLQANVNAQPSQPDLGARYTRAKTLWETRDNRVADKAIWVEVKQKLKQSHPRPGICQYYEYERITAIEHFFPKKYFPDYAFRWDNYLLICHNCNSKYKGDKFAVFNPAGSETIFELPITRGSYPSPPSNDAVLINPRSENPQDSLLLDLGTGAFIPTPGTDARRKTKAVYTRALLHLNTDDNLVRYRKKAYDGYLRKLEEYIKIKAAFNFSALLNALPPAKRTIVIQTSAYELEKNRLLELIKNDILNDPFPTVWLEIKTQKDFLSHIAILFEDAPEALTW